MVSHCPNHETWLFTYEANVDLPPSGQPIRIYPPGQTIGASFIVQFTIGQTTWVGQFFAPRVSAGTIRVVQKWVTDTHAAVLVDGQCYLVDVANPNDWRVLEAPLPARELKIVDSQQLALVRGDSSLACYSEGGLLWKSDRLVINDLRIRSVEQCYIVCEGYLPWDERYQFRVHLYSGEPLDVKVAAFCAAARANM